MSLPVYVVDAFTHSAFGGNPAAVCILNTEKPDQWLQQVAAEFNLSETAFLLHEQGNRWNLRWFTPTCEVKLCGHATLASAHVLANELEYQDETFIFSSLSGDLKARVNADSITLDFPRISTQQFKQIPANIASLNLKIINAYQAGDDIMVELGSEAEVFNYAAEIGKIQTINTRGLILTAPSSNAERDFVSRFFAPSAGINEDPVTGSAHCSLAHFWGEKLQKNQLRAEQLSARRGILNLHLHETRVDLIGNCVTFLKGRISSI